MESLYLENDLDIKKIAEKTGWDVKEIAKKVSYFYTTEEEIQELIYKFRIINPKALENLFPNLYRRKRYLKMSINFYKITLKELVQSYKLYGSFEKIAEQYKTTVDAISKILLDSLNSLEDFSYFKQELSIKDITSFRKISFQGVNKLIRLGFYNALFPDLVESKKYHNINYEKAKEIIIDNGYHSFNEIKERDRCLFSAIFNYLNSEERSNLPLKSQINWKNYFSKFPSKKEGIRFYIADHNIYRPKDIPRGLMYYYMELSWEEKVELFPNLFNNWIEYLKGFDNNFEAVLYYVRKNNIKTSTELSIKAKQLYDIYRSLSNEQKEIIFPGVTSGSGWERRAESDLQKNFSDCTTIPQKKFEDCKNIKQLPFDISLFSPSGKLVCLVEIHGTTHFKEVHGDFKKIRRRDIIKHDYCKKNNIPLFYFTYEPSLVEKYGYPYFVFTDFEELVKAIREILQKVS